MISSSLVLLLAVISCIDSEELTQPESLTIRPDATLTINCKVSYSVTSYATAWIRQPAGKALEWIGLISSGGSLYYKDSLKSKFSISRDTSSNTITLQGQNMRAEDTAVYYCARVWSGAFDYWGKGTMVTVTSAQQSPPKSIFGMSQCTSDSDGFVTLGCMTKGFSPADGLTFTWKDYAKNLLSGSVQYPAFGSNGDYTQISHLRVRKSDWDPKKPYQCEASNSQGKITSPDIAPQLPPPDVRATLYLTAPTKTELENEKATFMCLAQRFSPKTFTFKWYLDGKEVTSVIDTCDKSEKIDSVIKYSATSVLQISAADWKTNSKVMCEFIHVAGNETKEAINPGSEDCSEIAVDIVPPSLEAMLKNRTGVLKCKSSSEIDGFTKIKITADNQTIAEKATSDQKKVEIDAPIGYEEWSNGTEFTCTVEHKDLAEPKSTTFTRENGKTPKIPKKPPTVFILAPPEHKPGEQMTLTCYLKDFYPKEVFVSWLADDEPVTSKYSTSQPIQRDQTFSVYSQLRVNDSKWKDGTVFSCVVYHEGIDENMRVLTRSITDDTDKAGVINLSMNTPASCKA